MPAPNNISRAIRTCRTQQSLRYLRGVGSYTAIDATLPFTVGRIPTDVIVIYTFDVYNIGMVIITISNPYYRITDITVSRVCQSSFTDLMPVPAVPYQLVICELVISVLFCWNAKGSKQKRTARFHHKAVGGRHQVIIILRSRIGSIYVTRLSSVGMPTCEKFTV